MTAVKANGITIEYEEKGNKDGSPLILIRGLGTQLIDWPEKLIDGLAEGGFRVIYHDNRDVGLSSKIDHAGSPDLMDVMQKVGAGKPIKAPYTISDMAQDVTGLMDVLEISTANVFGISMGGMIAQSLAAKHGLRVRSMISVMSSSGNPDLPPGNPEAMGRLFSAPPEPGDRDAVIAHGVETLKVIGSPGFPETESDLFKIAANRYDRCYCPEGVARQMMAVMSDGSRVEMLKSISVPSLVIHGLDDPLVPVEAGRDTAKHIPNASLKVIGGMGHNIPDELVPRFVDLITRHAQKADTAE